MAKQQPVLGFPSKTAATLALFRDGHAVPVIATMTGSTPAAVAVAIRDARRSGTLPPSADRRERPVPPIGTEPHRWTPAKREKAQRLFARTMNYIAEALDVPTAELLSYLLDGAPVAGELVAPAAAEPAAEPTREDDEAELAALDAAGAAGSRAGNDDQGTTDSEADATEPVAEVGQVLAIEAAEPIPTYRLQNPSGAWLARDLAKFTYRLVDAWCGTGVDIERLGKVNRRFRELEPMRAT